MFLTPEQKTKLLQLRGLSSSEWSVTDDGNFEQVVRQQPSSGPEVITPKLEPVNSSLSSGVKSFAASALPSIGSGLGAAAGLAMAPASGGLSLLLPLLGGIGGGIATSAAQSAIMPDELKQNLATAQQEHPIASFIGGLGAMPLGGFYPSPKNIATAAGAVPKLLTGLERTAAEQSALINSAAGVGIGAGTSAVEPLLQGQAPSIGDVLAGAALGATFNTPNRIGTKLGFHDPAAQQTIIESARGNVVDAPENIPQQTVAIEPQSNLPLPLSILQSINPDSTWVMRNKGKRGNLVETRIPSVKKEDLLTLEDATAQQKAIDAENVRLQKEQDSIARQKAQESPRRSYERQAAIESQAPPRDITAEVEALTNENARMKSVLEAEKQRLEQEQQILSEQMSRENAAKRNADLMQQNLIAEEQRKADVENTSKQLGMRIGREGSAERIMQRGVEGEEIRPTNYVDRELPQVTEAESAADLEARKFEDKSYKYQQAESDPTSRPVLREDESGNLVDINEPPKPVTTALGGEIAKLNKTGDEEFLPKLRSFIQDKLGIKTDIEGNLVDKDGKPVKGSTTFNKGVAELIKLSADKSSLDTPAHEVFHAFLNTLRESPRAGDRRLVAEYERLIESSPDYQKWKAARSGDATPEEYAATNAGFEFVKRLVNVEKPFEKWWNDFHSYLKTRFTKHATEDDFRRLINYRMLEAEPKIGEFSKGTYTGTKYSGDYLDQTDTPEFKKWFEDSKVVDQNGKPIVVYHGTGTDFTVFNKRGSYSPAKYGYFFSSSPEAAGYFAKRPGNAQIKPLYLSFKKPFVKDLEGKKSFTEFIDNVESLKKKGYDGFIYKNAIDGNNGIPHDVYIATESAQIKSATGNRGTFDPNNPDIRYSDYSPLPFLTSRYDKVADKFKKTEHETIAKYVTENLHKFRGDVDLHNVGPELIQNTEGYSPEEIQRMYKYLHGKNVKEDSGITLTAREQELANKHIESVRKPRRLQQSMGMLVKEGKNLREAGINPDGYMWSEVAPEVAYEWAERPYSEKSKEYDKLYINHLEKHGIKDAAETLRQYKQAMGDNFARSAEFPALRKAKGVGLPWELVDQNYHSAAYRYGKRAAHDLSYFKHIQNDPKMLSALGLNDQTGARVMHPDAPYIGHDRHVQSALRDVLGANTDLRSPELVAATRAVGNTIMGVGTAVRNIANMPAFVAQYVQVKQLPLAFRALSKLAESRAEAFKVGATKPDYQSFDAAGKYEGSPNRFVALSNKLSSLLRKYQGRDLSDNFEGEYYYALGKELALDNIYRAQKGNKESEWFVKHFSDVTDTPVAELLKGNFTEADISKMAKRFVDAARGTYGSEGLPAWAQEGWIAPFAALSRFSIEKSNTIWKDVIMPMKQGIYGPFIRYTLATAGVALGIEEINKLLSGRKGSDPTIPELAIEGKADDYVYKAIALAQLGSYAGWMSDLAKMTANLAEGKPLKYSQPLSFPLYTLATETVGANVADAINALKEGEDPFTVGVSLLQTIATQANQTYRYVDANFINPAETERKEKFRDMRVFQELTDIGNQESPTHVNVVGNTKLREFKRTDDITKASTLASELLEDAFKKANGNPEMLKKELSRLKQNSYQTMPSPETMPQTFIRFLNFLSQRDGEKAAAERLNDFIQQRQINEAKSSLIP